MNTVSLTTFVVAMLGFCAYGSNACWAKECEADLARLTEAQGGGTWGDIDEAAKAVLQCISDKPDGNGNVHHVDTKKNSYRIVWGGVNYKNETVIRQVLVHNGLSEKHGYSLPGVSKMYTVFFPRQNNETLRSEYTEIEVEDPLIGKLPAVSQKLMDLAVGVAVRAGGRSGVAPELSFFIDEVEFHHKRSSIQVLDALFDSLTATKPVTSSAATLSNTPRDVLGLGLSTFILFEIEAKGQRVKVDGGDVVADPLGRSAAAIALSIHPCGYDRHSRFISTHRFHFLTLVALKPDPGLGLTMGYTLLHGLSVDSGYILFLIEKPRPGQAIGQPPVDTDDPFVFSRASSLCLGLTYEFK